MRISMARWVKFMGVMLLACVCSLPLAGQKAAQKFELLANSPAFWNLMDHDAKLETVATGFGFTEGPVWDPAGFLYVSDEEINKIYRVHLPDGRKEEFISLGD